MTQNKSLLFVCTHGIGDLLMTMPVIRLMAENGFCISFFLKGRPEREVAEYILDDLSFICKTREDFKSSQAIQAFQVVRWLRKQHIQCAFAQYGVNPPLFSLLTFFGGVRQRIGWKGRLSSLNTDSIVPGRNHKTIETARYLDLLGIYYSIEALQQPLHRNDGNRDPGLIIFGPGSGELESHKRWPKEKYARLASVLTSQNGYRIEILGTPSEIEICESIAKESGSSRVVSLAGKLSISESFERLKNAGLVVANCNGLAHMAAAMDTPVVGIYGPTNPSHTGPLTEQLSAVSLGLKCSPCYHKGYIEGCSNPVCMKDIEVAQVHNAVLAAISKNGRRKDESR